jgi:glycosyltransferase involved in cell wall biosynthesis
VQVLVIGPSPPPANGMSEATGLVLRSLAGRISFAHLDTADRRGLANMGHADLTNVALAGRNGLLYLWFLLTRRPVVVYIPISQNRLGFLRDCLFLVPARLLKKQVVVHLHGSYFANFYRDSAPWMRCLIHFALAKARRAIVLGDSLADIFDGIIPRECVRVIPNGIADHGRVHVQQKSEQRTIIFLSALTREKGVLDVLACLPRVAEKIPDLRVLLVGECFRESVRETATDAVRRMRLESQVRFLGPADAPRKYALLHAADVFVLPSYNEGQPFSILEAMAAGLPVVSTWVGCIPEMVMDGVNGFLCEPGDIKALAEKLASLLLDDELREKMGAASRALFLARFTQEKFSTRLNDMFEEVLSEQKRQQGRAA